MAERSEGSSGPDWRDPSYLAEGTASQRRAWRCLKRLELPEHLSAFDPLVVGTIPIDVDVADSDIDIICEADELSLLERSVRDRFEGFRGFSCHYRDIDGLPSLVAAFEDEGLTVEIFGQNRPTREQTAFVHMAVEHRLLALAGPWLRTEVRRLKSGGLKTEPAFAAALGLPGDPYEAMAALRHADDSELSRLLRKREPNWRARPDR